MTTGAPTPPSPSRPRPGRLRRVLPLALAGWFVVEIWLLTLVAGAAGGFTVFLLLVAGAVLGGVVIKAAGRRAFRNLTEAVQQAQNGTPPTAPRAGEGSGLVMLAGLLLIVPGLISDALGLLLLLPPVRGFLGRRAERALERRMRAAAPGSLGDVFQQARTRGPGGKVVQGEVVRDEEPAPGPGTREHRPPLTP
ncbi:FxsA family membrane protein [Streptomyces sp. JNUCC 64]